MLSLATLRLAVVVGGDVGRPRRVRGVTLGGRGHGVTDILFFARWRFPAASSLSVFSPSGLRRRRPGRHAFEKMDEENGCQAKD